MLTAYRKSSHMLQTREAEPSLKLRIGRIHFFLVFSHRNAINPKDSSFSQNFSLLKHIIQKIKLAKQPSEVFYISITPTQLLRTTLSAVLILNFKNQNCPNAHRLVYDMHVLDDIIWQCFRVTDISTSPPQLLRTTLSAVLILNFKKFSRRILWRATWHGPSTLFRRAQRATSLIF
ncbi:Signal peptidase complex catalytic subunit [Trichinella pseudospiralis]